MIHDVPTSGGTVVSGYGVPAQLHVTVARFGVGETLYYIDKARRGILEKVVIKAIRAIVSKRTPARGKVLYVDTFNGLWNEWDLVPQATADALVDAYFENLLDEANSLTGGS